MIFDGFIDLPWWGYVVLTLILTHITIASVTIYLHRCQAHRALDLHPIISHFFRFWLWLTTGMVTKEWAAIHRKHHAKTETAEDPHSPQVLGLKKVLFEGAELYSKEASNPETLQKYGRGTPDDWLERHIYSKYSVLGISLLLIIDFALFGFIGITVWAVQMLWIPFFAAGIINGVAHFWGYRNFQTEDASKNIVPWGIIIGGEELHNNHHAYATSAKLSSRKYEFDIGWCYIRLMEILHLAQVKKIAPPIKMHAEKAQCDADTLQAVITHRYDVLARYAKSLKKMCADEISKLKELRAVPVNESKAQLTKSIKRWLHRDAKDLHAHDLATLDEVRSKSKVLDTVYSMRQELSALWQRSTASREQLVRQLNDWCHRAEASGIAPLQEFSRRLRRYA